MGIDTRARQQRGAGIAAAVLAVLACAVAWSSTLAAAPAAGATPSDAALRASSDAQLAAMARRRDAEATRIGGQLLAADARRSGIIVERDAARGLLGEFLAHTYRQDATRGGGLVGAVLSSTSLREAADRVRVAHIVGEHHASLIRSLDVAESRLEVSRFERAQLIARLAAAQAELVEIAGEQDRRATVRAHAASRRADRRRAAAARTRARTRSVRPAAAAAVPGTIVAAPQAMGGGGAASAASIDAYLSSKGSPMAGQGAAFVASGQRWRVDPRLLVAIAGAESSFGKLTCGPHNAWGWACPNDPADFGSWAAGIDTVTRGLRRYYLDEGRTSVSLIQQKYCPVGAANDPTDLNSHWTANVTKFLVEQGGNPSVVGPGPGGGASFVPSFGGLGLAVD